jgi:hypothetical protein
VPISAPFFETHIASIRCNSDGLLDLKNATLDGMPETTRHVIEELHREQRRTLASQPENVIHVGISRASLQNDCVQDDFSHPQLAGMPSGILDVAKAAERRRMLINRDREFYQVFYIDGSKVSEPPSLGYEQPPLTI